MTWERLFNTFVKWIDATRVASHKLEWPTVLKSREIHSTYLYTNIQYIYNSIIHTLYYYIMYSVLDFTVYSIPATDRTWPPPVVCITKRAIVIH